MREAISVHRGRRSVWFLTSLFVSGVGASAVLARDDGVTFGSEAVMFGLASLLFTGLGSLIILRVPGNRLGWVISAAGLTILGSGVAGQLSDLGVVAVLGFGGALWMSTIALLGFLTLWFPTGRPPTPRWRWIEWFGYLMLLVVVFLSLFSEQFCMEPLGGRCLAYVDNPIGIAGLPDLEYGVPGFLGGAFVLFVGSAVVSLVARFVRSRGVERLQLKWFTYAVALLVGSIGLESIAKVAGLAYFDSWIADALYGLLFLAVPVSAVLAVLRYRLYDIDRIISRTVSYAIVIGTLAAVYLVAATVLAQSFPVESDLAVVGATLAVVALFAPLRRRVQASVDRRFNRTRYFADREMAAFAHRVRDTTDLATIEADVRLVIDRTMQPVTAGIWFIRSGDD